MLFIEWVFVILSTYIFGKSLNRIIYSLSKSVSDYVIVAVYVLNCIPVLLDLILGVPIYQPYFSYFTIAQSSNNVRLVYDIYILLIVLSLGLYSKKANSIFTKSNTKIEIYGRKSNLFSSYLLIFLPFFHVAFSPNAMGYLTIYGQAVQRGATSAFGNLNAIFCLVSVIAFCQKFFLRDGRKYDYLILLVYSFMIVWLNGKRNIVLILAVLFVFYYNNTAWSNKHKINMKLICVVFSVSLLVYSTNYLIDTKGTIRNTWEEIYTMNRIDFGRDDVTKFVIYEESFERNMIQEYRAQGLIATILMFVPREFWPDKPYPHYRYLTAKLVGTSAATVHFGMTPSVIEQSIADFGNTGYPICIIFLLLFCRYTDKQKSIFRKALLLILALGMLSMSMDYLAVYAIIYIIAYISSLIRKVINAQVISNHYNGAKSII